ncbi:MAG: SPFH domain-containing protein [Clostridiales bacterium]|nr:SPFH domain-containing protein [Clostridiales bacterium]
MGLFLAFEGTVQENSVYIWNDSITAAPFDELAAVVPGVLGQPGVGADTAGAENQSGLFHGAKVFVPDNTAVFVFSQFGVEEVYAVRGGYLYQNPGLGGASRRQIAKQAKDGSQGANQKQLGFINLREIRGIRFGTRGTVAYHDAYYDEDMEVSAFGSFSLKITNPERFVRNFMPACTNDFGFDDPSARAQILPAFLQSFALALNTLSQTCRIAQLPSRANEITAIIAEEETGVGKWKENFGFEVTQVGIESIEFSPDSKAFMKLHGSQQTKQVKQTEKVEQAEPKAAVAMSLDQQIETLKKLKELLDVGILTEEEFTMKKKEIMGF